MTHYQPDPGEEANALSEHENEHIKVIVESGYQMAYDLSGNEAYNPDKLRYDFWQDREYIKNLLQVLMNSLLDKVRSGDDFDFPAVMDYIFGGLWSTAIHYKINPDIGEKFLGMLVYELAIRDKHAWINHIFTCRFLNRYDITSLLMKEFPQNKETGRYPTLLRAYLDNLSSKNIALGQLIRQKSGAPKEGEPLLPAELLNIIDSLDEDKAKTYCLLITLFICEKIAEKKTQLVGLEAYKQFIKAIQHGGLASKQYIIDAVARINKTFLHHLPPQGIMPYLEERANLPAPLGKAKKCDAKESAIICESTARAYLHQYINTNFEPTLNNFLALKAYLDSKSFNDTLTTIKRYFLLANQTNLLDIIKPHIQFGANDFMPDHIYSPSWIWLCRELPEKAQAHFTSMNSVVDYIVRSIKETEAIAGEKGTNFQAMTELSGQIDSTAADSATPIGEKLKIMLMQISDTHNNIRKAKAGSPEPTFEIGAFKMTLGGAGSTTADKLSTIVTGALTHMSLDPVKYCVKDQKTHLLNLNTNIDKIIDILNSLPQPSQPPQPSSPRGSKC